MKFSQICHLITVIAVAGVAGIATGGSVAAATVEHQAYAVFKSTDRGQTWMRSGDGLPKGSRVNAFGSSQGVLLVGTDAGIFASSDGARHWRPVLGTTSSSGRIIAFASLGQRVFAGTDGNGLWVSPDGGASWQKLRSFPFRKARCLLAHQGAVYVGTETDGVFRSNDAGDSWTQLSAGLPSHAQIFSLSTVRGKLLAGLYSRGLYGWDESMNAWGKIGAVTPLALATVKDMIIAGHNPGGIYSSKDLGVSWLKGVGESSVAGLLEPLASGDPGGLRPVAPVWALESGDDLVVAGVSAGIYYSTNLGQTWIRARKGLPETSQGIAFLLTPDLILAGARLDESDGDPLSSPKK